MRTRGRRSSISSSLTERLRRDCPWDREQTARTIVPHTVEEAYEVADAALADDPAKLLDELGDLLFQVYFLALLLEEQGEGDLEAVARGVHEKLVRRHPHVFGDVEAETAGRVREELGADQARPGGARGRSSTTSRRRCRRCSTRARCSAARPSVGFEYPDVAGALADLEDELAELKAELDQGERRAARRGARRPALRRA